VNRPAVLSPWRRSRLYSFDALTLKARGWDVSVIREHVMVRLSMAYPAIA